MNDGEGVKNETSIFTPEDKKALKFLYPDEIELAKSKPMVIVRNQANTWVGAIPFTEELKSLFYGSPHFYVKAVPQASGRLHIMEFVDNQGW